MKRKYLIKRRTADTLYVNTHGNFQSSFGNTTKFIAELKKVERCDYDTYLKYMTLYKLQNLPTSHCADTRLKCLENNDTILVVDDHNYALESFHNYKSPFINKKAYDSYTEFYKIYIYKVVNRNFINPNREKINNKAKETRDYYKEISKEIPIISNMTKNSISINQDILREYVNNLLVEKGYNKINEWCFINLS